MNTYVELGKKTLSNFLIVTIIYILAGTLLGFWNLWFLYLVPPAIFYFQHQDNKALTKFTKIYLSFFIATTGYLAIGGLFDIWHPTWLVYLLPIIFVLNKNDDK